VTSRKENAGIPEIILERYRLGELSAEQTAELEGQLQTDEALRHRLDQLALSDEEIRRRYPPGWLADRIRERRRAEPGPSPSRRAAWSRYWPAPVALAAVAVLLVMLAPRAFGPLFSGGGVISSASPDSPDRIKGLKPALVLFRRTAEGAQTLAEGAVVRPGDQIRVGYRSAGHAFGAIVSVDGRGSVSVHLAQKGTEAAPLQSGDTVLLEQAFELDDAPLFERFYLVVAEEPFPIAPVVEAARRAALEPKPGAPPALVLPPQYQQFAITLAKEALP
jgi:hypothetical protein